MTLHPKWISEDFWVCRAHIPAARLPAVQSTCYYCGAERPSLQRGQVIRPFVSIGDGRPSKAALRVARQQQKEQVRGQEKAGDPVLCAWGGCANAARPGSLYCSRNCSNKNARARHTARKSGSGTHFIGIDPAIGPDMTAVTTVQVTPEGQVEVVKTEILETGNSKIEGVGIH